MTAPSEDVAQIAARLTEAQKRALFVVPAWGFPAGHNFWPETEYWENDDPDSPTVCTGEDMDVVLRAGLVAAEPDDAHPKLCEFDEADAKWALDLTPLGLRVRAHLQASAS